LSALKRIQDRRERGRITVKARVNRPIETVITWNAGRTEELWCGACVAYAHAIYAVRGAEAG
jgi:hypothetical protein